MVIYVEPGREFRTVITNWSMKPPPLLRVGVWKLLTLEGYGYQDMSLTLSLVVTIKLKHWWEWRWTPINSNGNICGTRNNFSHKNKLHFYKSYNFLPNYLCASLQLTNHVPILLSIQFTNCGIVAFLATGRCLETFNTWGIWISGHEPMLLVFSLGPWVNDIKTLAHPSF
jgi:hypothetical protein